MKKYASVWNKLSDCIDIILVALLLLGFSIALILGNEK